MEKLTNEQMAWALEWSAMHLIEHDTQAKAVEELRHCAKHFRVAAKNEKPCKSLKVSGIDPSEIFSGSAINEVVRNGGT